MLLKWLRKIAVKLLMIWAYVKLKSLLKDLVQDVSLLSVQSTAVASR